MRAWFGLIFAASGAAALIYEVTWTRLLTLQLGHGVAAASTVLAAFMGGLAVGAALGGRWGARLEPGVSLKVYAALEILIALLALALPLELDALVPLLVGAYADGSGGPAFAVLRLAASFLLLSIPAAAMGATFPLAARWFVERADLAARDAGALYAANTVGAAAGALLAGFLLLPALGLSGATWVGVLLNTLAAGGAWAIAVAGPAVAGGAPAPVPAEPLAPGARPGRRRHRPRGPREAIATQPGRPGLAAAALGLSGFASLTLQVVWTRLLALILGPTTYAFSTVVAVFIGGLAVGSALASRLAARTTRPLAWLSAMLALSGGCAVAAASLIDRGLLSIAALTAEPDVTFGAVLWRQAVVAVGLLAPMTIAFGAAFPLAVAVGTRRDHVTADIGLIYAVNTAGAIAGALLTGFVLIGWLGLHGTIRLVAVAGALGAIGLLAAGGVQGRPRLAAAGLAMVVLAAGVRLPPWDRLLLSSGAYKYSGSLRGLDLETALTAGELVYYGEGPSGTVAVRRAAGTTSLAIDGKVDASDAGDMLTQRLLAHLPLLLHPDPSTVAVLGLGSGVTLGSALTHPIDHADVLEISPEVVEGARAFEAVNHRPLADPRTRLIVGDGRTHLLLTRQTYDVIVSEPSNPWMAGIASLFTREFFEAARDRLRPGGVLCQWAHTYDISTHDLQSIVATFISVFPDGTLWLVGDGDVLLIGSTVPLAGRLDDIGRAWSRPGVAGDLASVGVVDPFQLLSMFVAQGRTLADWTAGVPLQFDDRAALEFSGPRSVFGRTGEDNASILRALRDGAADRPPAVTRALRDATWEQYRDRGWMLFRADAVRPAYDDFQRALEAEPNDRRALDGLVQASAAAGRQADARTLLTRLAANPTHEAARIALSRLLASEGAIDEAVQLPLGILEDDPSNVAALEQLASVLSDVGDIERMRPVVARLRAEAPGSAAAHYYSVALLFMEERLDLALAEARQVIELSPDHARAHNLAGASLATLGHRDQARTAFQASIAADPHDPATYTNLAQLELQAGNPSLAARYFAEALTVDPTFESARQGLAALSRD